MWWSVIKILWVLVPAIISAVREQRIRQAAADDVIKALHKRIEEARKAPIPDEANDNYNRSRPSG